MMHALILVAALAAAAGPRPPDHIERARQWVEDVIHHQPGTMDEAASDVASWSNRDLQTLWIDLTTIGELLYRPKLSYFTLVDPKTSRKKPINYTPDDLDKLKKIATRARDVFGADGTLRRGALLHADIAMNTPFAPDATGASNPFAPVRVTVQIGDGQAFDIGLTAIHWETARMLIDRSPRDGFARDWYRATSAWMAQREDHDVDHVDHAIQLFPDDPDLLFLDGCLHEVLASPQIQSSVQSLHLPSGFLMNVGTPRAELKLAENALRRAAFDRPERAEGHLHYGRVLDRLGEHDAAVAELSRASGALSDDTLEYVADLFLGSAHASAGHLDAARAAYESAEAC